MKFTECLRCPIYFFFSLLLLLRCMHNSWMAEIVHDFCILHLNMYSYTLPRFVFLSSYTQECNVCKNFCCSKSLYLNSYFFFFLFILLLIYIFFCLFLERLASSFRLLLHMILISSTLLHILLSLRFRSFAFHH